MPDQSLREVLPLLRPRSADPTIFTQTVFYLLWLGLATLAVLYFVRRFRLRKRRRQEFQELAGAQGLTDEQIGLLLRVAGRDRMKTPLRLLTSARFFDRHVGEYAAKIARRDLDHPLLDKIGIIRLALGFDDLPVKETLASSRQIAKGQTLMVRQESDGVEGFTPWLVVVRDEAAIGVVPLLKDDQSHFDDLNLGDSISVRFWRKGDTEYRFDTEVISHDSKTHTYLLAHSSKVNRLQQRDFYRIEVDFYLTLFGLPEQNDQSPEAATNGPNKRTVIRDDAAITMLESSENEFKASGIEDTVTDHKDTLALDSQDDLAPTETDDKNHRHADTPSTPAHVESDSSQSPAIDSDKIHLESRPKIDGRVVNVSAGGLGVLVRGDFPAQVKRWLTDPSSKGPFPLAGITCHLIGTEQNGPLTTLKLKFEDLPPNTESAIVRKIYQHQLTDYSVDRYSKDENSSHNDVSN